MTATRDRWYRQPVLWVAAAIALALLAAYVGVIVLALRNPDVPLQPDGEQLLRVPVAREADRRP